MRTQDRWQPLREAVGAYERVKHPGRALFGFDGYIDSLYAVVERTDDRGNPSVFQTSDAFLRCLMQLQGQSAERELLLKSRRAGGNAPLSAMAAGALGVDAHCVGYVGQEEFARIGCRMTSLGAPAECIALEFANCKWMLSCCESLHAFTARGLERQLGREALCRLLEQVELIALLNWAAMPENAGVVQMLLEDYWERAALGSKTFFVDFSDISSQAERTIARTMDVLGRLSRRAHVVVSVNLHEAQSIAQAGTSAGEETLLRRIHERTGAQEIVLHAMDHALCLEDGVLAGCRGAYHPAPVITTGGGDHFNGGYCAARLANLPAPQRLALATCTALYYVAHGTSGSAARIRAWLDSPQLHCLEESSCRPI